MFEYLQQEIIYGPVHSRRLGNSLGINLFPNDSKKFCSFNCSYCFFKIPSNSADEIFEIADISEEKVISEIERWKLNKQKAFSESDYITFSGNGEPTIHPNFPSIAKSLFRWRNTNAKDKKLAIFTNGSKLKDENVYEALLNFDDIFIKFDVGSEKDFKNLCKPNTKLSFEEYYNSVKSIVGDFKSKNKNITIQTAIVQQYSDKTPKGIDLQALIKSLKDINPNTIDFYELNFDGTEHEKYEYFDNLNYVQQIEDSFKDFQIERNFWIEKFETFQTVYIQYAVDSLLYVPVYIADKANLFKKNGITPEFRVPKDGDLGAIKALIKKETNFALCDPFVIFSNGISPADREKCSLVEIIIKKVGLWCICDSRINNIEDIFQLSRNIHTYSKGSTANKITQSFNKKHKKKLYNWPPGEEFSKFCLESNPNSDAFIDDSVITADILTSQVCKNCLIRKNSSSEKNIISFSLDKQINPFLFTGLIVNTDYCNKNPDLVQRVIKSINEAIEMFYNRSYLKYRELDFIEYLSKVINSKSPVYSKCRAKPDITNDIKNCLDKLIDEKIYEPKSIFNTTALLKAFKIHSSFNKNIKLKEFRKYLDHYNTKSIIHLKILKILLSSYWVAEKLHPTKKIYTVIFLFIALILSYIFWDLDLKILNIITILGLLLGLIPLIYDLIGNKK